MRLEFRESFAKDAKRIRERSVRQRIKNLILRCEQIKSLSDIPHLKKLAGTQGFYRIRVGDYRVGLILEGDVLTFVRVLHRKDIYRYFP